ncbi:MAG: N-formylglutamate amidohydrolase [Acetobacteraceae bacterium]|nr:N-formylglutamate amidohydrolase [Acetobacteraceae bacterium]
MDVPVATLPFALQRPDRQTAPVVVASPHSGRDYPPEFIAAARLDTLGLRRSEDSFVDELFSTAPDYGIPLLAATFPRAFCDPNREPWELDPAMFEDELPSWVNTTSPRVCAGLGTIARLVASGEMIYRDKLSFAEAERRVRSFWQPYHVTLTELIEQTRQIFGAALLIDCHSMPAHGSSSRHSGQAADFVLGDAHGTACSPRVVRFVERSLAGLGYTVRRNDPYSGGYVTRHYGRPRENIHVLQIEVARGLYMDEVRIERIGRFLEVRQDLSLLLAGLTAEVSELLSCAAR